MCIVVSLLTMTRTTQRTEVWDKKNVNCELLHLEKLCLIEIQTVAVN